jgi:hypothetical protein
MKKENTMSGMLKIAVSLVALAGLSACTVVPPRVAYSGPSVGIVAVGPTPYYAAPAPYYVAPTPYYAAPAYGTYWRRHGHGYRRR